MPGMSLASHIRRADAPSDRERYQTVFAKKEIGSRANRWLLLT